MNPPPTTTHILMTRFNLATPGREFAIRNQPGWLEGRFELFERYCLPSVMAQDGSPPGWIIYFDEDTPSAFRSRIERLCETVPFRPYFTGLFRSEGWARSLRETFPEAFGPERLLITTRLDNDDALARDYVRRIVSAAAEPGPERRIFNITEGVVRRGGAVYALRHPANPFFSLLEPAGTDIRTAHSIHHMAIDGVAPVTQVPGPAGWMQMIHDTNVSNRIRGRRIRPAPLHAQFGGDAVQDLEEPTMLALARDAVLDAPLRGAIDRLAALRGAVRR